MASLRFRRWPTRTCCLRCALSFLGLHAESAMGNHFSVKRHGPVVPQDASPRPASADVDTLAASPPHPARTASGPLQGLRSAQAQYAAAAAFGQSAGGEAGPATEAPDRLPEPRMEIASPSMHAVQHPFAVVGDGASCTDAEPPSELPELPPEMWTVIAHHDPVAQQRLRVVSGTLRAAAEVGIRQLIVKTPEGLAAVKRRGSYPNLRELILVGNFWGNDLIGLPATLRELDLSGCSGLRVTGLDPLLVLPLDRLNVGGCRLGAKGARQLAHHPTLTSLDMRGNQIGDVGAAYLAANPRLTALDVGDNGIGDSGVTALAKHATLTTLLIEENTIGDQGAQRLADNKTLTTLNVRKNGIGPDGGLALAANTSLVSLAIGHNRIGSGVVLAMAANKKLTSLDVEYTEISTVVDAADAEAVAAAAAAVAQVASALAANTSLVYLNVGTNCLGDEGARQLAASKTIKTLNISYNKIHRDGALALAANRTITSLDLGGNVIGAPSVKALADNTALATLNLRKSELEPEGVVALAANKTLASLDVGANKLGPDSVRMLLAQMKLAVLDATYSGCEPGARTELMALAARIGVTLRI
ncbi:GALA protein [Ralstonia pseudosolanacearum]|uniref:GALA protein n=1 Tax=Ralstonia pseudosolanacearum TaxID=1310165 RepID=UPI001E4DD012|nr:GALA protein [Ralstonia pseudosolanacearum]